MFHPKTQIDTLVRPRILVVAARHGLCHYRRDQDLPRLLGLVAGAAIPAPKLALQALMDCEAALEARRRRQDPNWRAARHVAVMTALIAEARTSAQAGQASGAVVKIADLAGAHPVIAAGRTGTVRDIAAT